MTGFKTLRDVCISVEDELRRVSSELFSVKIGETFEDGIAKKMCELSVFRAKLKLLQAKPIALTHQITEQTKDETSTYDQYTDVAMLKIQEQQIVKSVTQSHAVMMLLTTPDIKLDPELVDRKEKIIKQLNTHRESEAHLRYFDKLLKEKEEELQNLRVQWETELAGLQSMGGNVVEEVECSGPLYDKLCKMVDKMEMMRWMIGQLVTTRHHGYDWLADPHGRLKTLKLTREHNTVDKYLES